MLQQFVISEVERRIPREGSPRLNFINSFVCFLCLLWLNLFRSGLRRYPFLAVLKYFFLPDGHGAFELFDGPLTCLEGGAAMWRAGGDDDARFANLDAASAVH